MSNSLTLRGCRARRDFYSTLSNSPTLMSPLPILVEQLFGMPSGLLMSRCVVARNFCRDSLVVEGRWAIDESEGGSGRGIGSNG